jgi:phenylacetate-CoA ligase
VWEGELVVTNLGRLGSPVIRYRTGDRVRMTRAGGPSQVGSAALKRASSPREAAVPCLPGAFAWLEGGIIGRIDDMLIIRGNNVFPSAVEDILRRFAAIAEYRIGVEDAAGGRELRLELELTPGVASAAVIEDVTRAFRDRLFFRPRIVVVPPGALPRFEMKAKRLVK